MGGQDSFDFNKIVENVIPGAPRTRQTAATDVLTFFKLPVARIWRFRGAPRSTFSIVFHQKSVDFQSLRFL